MSPSDLPPLARTMSEPSRRAQTPPESRDDAESTMQLSNLPDASTTAIATAPITPSPTLQEHPHPGRSVSYSNRPVSGSGTRASRFIETPMFEYTPANSIYEEDLGGVSRSESQERRASLYRLALRIANGVSHLAVVVMLIAIMSTFLATSNLWYGSMSPEAAALVVFLSFDALFDIRALALCRTPWPGWALLARLLIGLVYLVIFMVYIGIGSTVFPYSFTYWGLGPGFGAPLVFLLIWVLGLWNLVQAAIHRYSFGTALGACLRLAGRNSTAAAAANTSSRLSVPAMAMTRDSRQSGTEGGGFMAAVRGLGIRSSVGAGARSGGDDIEAGRRRPVSSRACTVAPTTAQSSQMDLSTITCHRPQDKTMDSTSTLDNVRPPAAHRTG